MTTVSGPSAVTVSPASRNDGLPFKLISRLSDQTTSAEVTGRAVGELGLRVEVEDELSSAVERLERRGQVGHDVLEVAAVEGQQGVVERVADEVSRRLVHVAGVGRHELERVVDNERATRGVREVGRRRRRRAGHHAQQYDRTSTTVRRVLQQLAFSNVLPGIGIRTRILPVRRLPATRPARRRTGLFVQVRASGGPCRGYPAGNKPTRWSARRPGDPGPNRKNSSGSISSSSMTSGSSSPTMSTRA